MATCINPLLAGVFLGYSLAPGLCAGPAPKIVFSLGNKSPQSNEGKDPHSGPSNYHYGYVPGIRAWPTIAIALSAK